MTKRLLICVLGALLATACATREHRLPDPTRPQVFVAPGDYLVLNQEPILILRKPGQEAKITWRVGDGTVFERDGITIIGRVKTGGRNPERLDRPDPSQNQLFKCSSSENRLEFTCVIDGKVQAGQYAYAVNVARGGKRIVLDPTIMIRD